MNPLPILLGLVVSALSLVVVAIGIGLFMALRFVGWMRWQKKDEGDKDGEDDEDD